MNRSSQNIAIIGSGFLGLTLALRMSERGDNVTVYESASEIGGLAAAWQIGGVTWDKHYHVTLASDANTRKIVEELGLGDEFNWVETKTGFYTDGELYSMSNTAEFLKFPPLDLISKLRLGSTIFRASKIKDWKSLEQISVEEWLTKLSGKRTFDKIWRPLLMAKLGEAYRETSAAFIWATIQRMYAARNSGMKKEMFGYVRGGYARVLERFGEVLAERGVEIRLNSKVEMIEDLPSGQLVVRTQQTRRRNDAKAHQYPQRTKYAAVSTQYAVATGFSAGFLAEPALPSNRRIQSMENTFDKVILTCPSNIAARMLPQIEKAERQKLESIKYQGIICASVLMKCSLSPYYVTNITDEAPFTGVIEMSALVDKRELGRNALVYLPKYVAPADELFNKSDEEIERISLDGLAKMYPHFRRKDVLAFKVSRVRQVFPLPVLGYSESVPDSKTSVEGVYIVNSSHIVNGTLNVNETVALAERFFAEHL
ncbi:MAG TPA: NAD(P)/FAD-dependent oxidoreductase [Pyrinomonadaceae bacterium]|nr:NAD(P)/FAD-dependent oxidoreductase [Pyrinomonadaceae bacterium]